MEDAKKKVDAYYAKKTGVPGYSACKMIGDFPGAGPGGTTSMP